MAASAQVFVESVVVPKVDVDDDDAATHLSYCSDHDCTFGFAAASKTQNVATAPVNSTNAVAASKPIFSATAISETTNDFVVIWDCSINDTASRRLVLDAAATWTISVDTSVAGETNANIAAHKFNIDTAVPEETIRDDDVKI
ncbi:hypothetical protein ACH5RR_017765 [Cinchona calisaya]|uniref:Uncharacterized protein n=1 Tax=Cinchona calisaya TaxID=153742 RepID=A0ABD2ZJN3_9GENT